MNKIIFNIILSGCTLLLLIPAIIFYHYRDHVVELQLNGTVASQECYIDKDCQEGLCVGGYVTLNFTYNGIIYLKNRSVIQCCIEYNCCQDLVNSQQPIWIALGKNNTDPEHITMFSCKSEYTDYTYYYLCILFYCLFVIVALVSVVAWHGMIVGEKKPLLNKHNIINNYT